MESQQSVRAADNRRSASTKAAPRSRLALRLGVAGALVLLALVALSALSTPASAGWAATNCPQRFIEVDDDYPSTSLVNCQFKTIIEVSVLPLGPGDLVRVYNGTYLSNWSMTTNGISVVGESTKGVVVYSVSPLSTPFAINAQDINISTLTAIGASSGFTVGGGAARTGLYELSIQGNSSFAAIVQGSATTVRNLTVTNSFDAPYFLGVGLDMDGLVVEGGTYYKFILGGPNGRISNLSLYGSWSINFGIYIINTAQNVTLRNVFIENASYAINVRTTNDREYIYNLTTNNNTQALVFTGSNPFWIDGWHATNYTTGFDAGSGAVPFFLNDSHFVGGNPIRWNGGPALMMNNSSVRDSPTEGYYQSGGTVPVFSNVTFENTSSWAVWTDVGLRWTGGGVNGSQIGLWLDWGATVAEFRNLRFTNIPSDTMSVGGNTGAPVVENCVWDQVYYGLNFFGYSQGGRFNNNSFHNISGTAMRLSGEFLEVHNNTLNSTSVPFQFSLTDGINTINMYNFTPDNTVDGKPAYFILNKTGVSVPADASQIWIINSTDITVSGVNYTSLAGDSIWMTASKNVTVADSRFLGWGFMYSSQTSGITITNVTFLSPSSWYTFNGNYNDNVLVDGLTSLSESNGGNLLSQNYGTNQTYRNLFGYNAAGGIYLYQTSSVNITNMTEIGYSWQTVNLDSVNTLNMDGILTFNGSWLVQYSSRVSIANGLSINSTGNGIDMMSSSFVNLTNVTFLTPNGNGIYLDNSNNATLRNVTTYTEVGHGAYIYASPDLRTYNGTFVSPNYFAFYLDVGCFAFVAVHNNFYGGNISNTNNYGVWDAGYPAGGNYYDFAAASFQDKFTGPGQNSVLGRDGIKDAPPYPVSAGKNDNYALTEPWPPRILLVSPPDGSLIKGGTPLNFTVGAFFDAVSVTDNTTNVTVPFPFPHDIDTNGFMDGWHTITVRATDSSIFNRSLAAPNLTRSFSFEFDSSSPVFSSLGVVPLFANAIDSQAVLDIGIADPHLASWSYTIDNVTYANMSLPWSIDLGDSGLDLSPGPHLLVLYANDTLDNNVSIYWYFYTDAFAPALLRMNPSLGYFQPGTAIEYSASDDNLLWSLFYQASSTTSNVSYSDDLVMGSTNWEIDTTAFEDGCYDLQVRATDEANHETTDTWSFCVDNTNPDLSAFGVIFYGDEDVAFNFDGALVQDLDPTPDYAWTFDDSVLMALTTLRGPQPSYTFATPGDYNIHLRVDDRAGNFAQIDFQLTIYDTTDPVADFALNATLPEDSDFFLDASPTTDNDGYWNGGATGTFSWNIEGLNYSESVDGRNVTWNLDQPGVYNITLSVWDRIGNYNAVTKVLTVRDTTPPTIVVTGFRGPFNETDTVSLDASNSTDNDVGPGLLFSWRFTYNSAQQVVNGPAFNFAFVIPGTYTITLRVADRSAVENTTQIFVRINDVPAVTTAPATSFTLPNPYEGDMVVTDGDGGDTITFTLLSGPSGMAVSQAGVISWAPAASAYGVYSVVVRISDGLATVDYAFVLTAQRAPNAANRAPFFSSFPVQTGLPGGAYSYAAGIGDPDTGDTLSLVVAVGPAGMTVDATHVVHWTIPANGAGITYQVSLLLSDGLISVWQNYTIRARVGDVAPVFTTGKVPATATVKEGEVYTLVIDATFASDNDDTFDLLTFYATAADGTVLGVTVDHSGTTWTLKVTGLKPGTSNVNLRVADPSGLNAETPIAVTVAAAAVVAPPGEFPMMALLLLAALGGAGVLALVVMKRRKKDDGAEAPIAPPPAAVAPAAAPQEVKVPIAPPAAQAAEVLDVEVVAVPAAAAAATAAAAAVAAAPAAPAMAAKPKAATYVVEGLFVIYQDGRMIFSKTDIGRGEALGDPELVSSMFTAVQQFIKDSFSAEGELNKMGYGDNQILIERGKSVFMATINFGEPDKELQETMQAACEKMEYTYAGVIEKWDGNAASFQNLDKIVAPILALTAGVTRQDVLAATTTRDVKVLSQLEFFQGFVRLKVGVKNDTEAVITKVTLDIDFNEDVLRLQRIEPASYKTSGARVMLNVLNPGEKSSVAFYFDPQICTETNIDGIVRYRDYKGVLSSVTMKTRKAEVVCPLFFTKEHANTAMLKRLIENELQEKDSKVYTITKLPPYVKYKDIFDVTKSVVLSHDVHMVREFVSFNPFSGEAWFYGETKVKNYKIVIRAAVREDNTIEFFAASSVIKAVTGLLAEFNHTLTSMIVERYSDVKIEQVYDEAVKHQIQSKALIDKLGEGEAGAGETEQQK